MALGLLSGFSSLLPSAAEQSRHAVTSSGNGRTSDSVHRCGQPKKSRTTHVCTLFAASSTGSAAFPSRGGRRAFLQTSSCAALLSVTQPGSCKDAFAQTVSSGSRQSPAQEAPMASAAQFRLPAPPTRVTAPGRVIAIGDIHGDMAKAINALKYAGVLKDDNDRPVWIGGNTVVVQLGDVLDRGDNEIAAVMLLRELDRQARQEGGAVYMLNGNHESLNVAGDFRYVTEGAMYESAIADGNRDPAARQMAVQQEARLRLYSPGGRMARELSKNPTVLIVNDSVFAHGGLLPGHVKYGLARLNGEVAAWMRGDCLPDGSRTAPPFLAMGDRLSVMWNRTYGKEKFANLYDKYHACSQLNMMLELTACKRLVIGHTPQMDGLNSECDGKVWRVDVGMSSGVLNAEAQVLEIMPRDPSIANNESVVNVLGHNSAALPRPPPTVPVAVTFSYGTVKSTSSL